MDACNLTFDFLHLISAGSMKLAVAARFPQGASNEPSRRPSLPNTLSSPVPDVREDDEGAHQYQILLACRISFDTR